MVVQKEIFALIGAIAGLSAGCRSAPPPAAPIVMMRQLECPTSTAAVPAGLMDTCTPEQLTRVEETIDSGALFTLRVMTPLVERRGAVVLMHGAGSGGSAAFDLPGASLMRALACAGFDAYAFDARGFGGSMKPAGMDQPAEANPPLIRATDAARDLDAVVRFAAATSAVERPHLIGWSWGSDVAGLYAGEHPERIDRLILMAPVYDRRWPSRHLEKGGWREERRDEVVKFFSPEREERPIFDAAVDAMYRFAPTAGVVRLPNGPYRDIYGTDAPLWDAAKIRAPVLIIRGDRDKASLDPHALALYSKLGAELEKQYVVLGGLGHFLFRERRHPETFQVVTGFLRR